MELYERLKLTIVNTLQEDNRMLWLVFEFNFQLELLNKLSKINRFLSSFNGKIRIMKVIK